MAEPAVVCQACGKTVPKDEFYGHFRDHYEPPFPAKPDAPTGQ